MPYRGRHDLPVLDDFGQNPDNDDTATNEGTTADSVGAGGNIAHTSTADEGTTADPMGAGDDLAGTSADDTF